MLAYGNIEAVAIEPMIPTVALLPRGDRWTYEPKWDGWRVIVHVDATTTIYSRHGRNVTASVPELRGLSDVLQRPVVLDGELIAFERGRPSFYALSRRMSATRPQTVNGRRATTPVVFVAFDVLALDGRDVTTRSWAERRELLDSLHLAGPAWHASPSFPDVHDELPDICVSLGIEGVVAKRTDSRYLPGTKTRQWVKWKTPEWYRYHAPKRRPGRALQPVYALEREVLG